MKKENIFNTMENDIMTANLTDAEKNKLLKNVMRLKEQKLNIMITGATGCGKSSTINAMFDMEVATVGTGVEPETMEIEKYELDNLILWDTPGLGDGKEADERHTRNIIRKLKEVDAQGNGLIDLVLVILDGSSRDLGTSYDLINNVIIPNLGEDKQRRILVAINQADMAMKGRNWNYDKNQPNEKLTAFLEEKAQSVQKRIFEGTGVNVEPVYYSAGYKEDDIQSNPYNLSKLLYFIVKATPSEKRAIYVNNVNCDQNTWKDDDKRMNYVDATGAEIWDSIVENTMGGIVAGRTIGGAIGGILGETGREIGEKIGSIVGGIGGFLKGVLF